MASIKLTPSLWKRRVQFGVPVPRGKLAQSPAEVKSIIEKATGKWAIKSQIVKGDLKNGVFDNGLKGGIQIVENATAGEQLASRMLGHQLKTKHTTGDGLPVSKLYVTEASKNDQEWYLAMTFDREKYCPVIVVSKYGGNEVQSIPPDQLHTVSFGLTKGITPEIVNQVSKCLDAFSKDTESLQGILKGLYNIFIAKDATLLEINTLARSPDGVLTCLDANFTFDDAAGKRQKELFALRDSEHDVPEETEAERYGLVYVRMDGNIGNVVNGAGLAMATNDAIALHGGTSANFLDAGGQATKETMVKAFEIILRDKRVKTILVNIYGGITRGDMIAESIIGAATELGPLKVPMVVRLQGTNSELGLKMLEEANLGLHTEADFGKAAQKAVDLAR